MNKKTLCCIALCCMTILGCNKNKNSVEATEINIITGYIYSENSSLEIASFGNPNFRINHTYDNSNPELLTAMCYPNPANKTLTLRTNNPIKKLWIIPGKINNGFKKVDYSEIHLDTEYSAETLDQLKVKSISNSEEFNRSDDRSTIAIDELPEGFYRIFFITETNEMFWDNIYINRTLTEKELINYFESIWPLNISKYI